MTGCWQRGEGVMISCVAPGLDKGAPPAGRSLDSAHDVGRLTQADPGPGPHHGDEGGACITSHKNEEKQGQTVRGEEPYNYSKN